MCLSIAVKHPERLLAKGEHLGYEWNITHNGGGYRCGYVKVLPGHPWFRLGIDGVYADVHGGITFTEADVPCDGAGADNGWWVGFDCAHAGDAPDPALLPNGGLGSRDPYEFGFLGLANGLLEGSRSFGVIRDTDYVKGECYNLCEQAREAASD